MATAESTPIRLLRSARASAPARRAGAVAARIPAALVLLLTAGVLLRLAVILLYQPAVVNNADTPTYVTMADGGLFGDPVRPSGYPLFMIAVHWISDQLAFTIAVQHLLGIATALLLYAAARRIGAPVWVGAVGAAAVLLSLDQIVLEHMVLSDALFTFQLAIVLYLCVRALDEPQPLRGPLDTRHVWIVGAALMLALATWVRGVALPMIPFLLVWIALALPGSWQRCVGRAALAGAAAGAVMLAYFALNDSRTGTFGFTQSSGWALYSRVAPFADCDRFDPPSGTELLCERSKPVARFGPDFYGWEAGSPAIKAFTYPPNGNDQLGAFARQVIVHQPIAYVQAAGTDVLRYFLPDYHTYAFGGPGYDTLDIGRKDPVLEHEVLGWLSAYYRGDFHEIDDGVSVLSEVQDWVRVQPLLMLAAMLLGVAGIVVARGRVRAVLVLVCGMALLLVLIPSATANYNVRYVIPAGGPIVLGGAIGAWAVFGWVSTRRRGDSGTPSDARAASG
jgi:hypothetical protein